MIRFLLFAATVFALVVASIICIQPKTQTKQKPFKPIIVTNSISEYVGEVPLPAISVRILVLKHCPDSIANTDANEVVQAAKLASSKGLTIEDVGNFHVDDKGKTDRMVWSDPTDLSGLKKFVNEQMKVKAAPGDTFVIYTIGHGSENGSVMRLGQRAGIMKILAECAEENDQETFWWQTSCHAGAHLPPISSLTPKQQDLFSMSASSPASKVSYFCTQGKIMEKVFCAMAARDPVICPNGEDIVTAASLSAFISKECGKERGELIYAKSPDKAIFGLLGGLPNRIPIIDRMGPQKEYPRTYIPIPKRCSIPTSHQLFYISCRSRVQEYE
jgi:hypothetical protein